MNNRIRVYADASVYGGAFDEEFDVASQRFFERVRAGRFRLVVSTVVRDELVEAPERVRTLFDEMHSVAEVVDITEESVRLQEAYLAAGIVAQKWENRCAARGPSNRIAMCRNRKLELQTHRQFPEDPVV